MSWAAENKFMAGFSAAMFVGLGGLGYLTFSASKALDNASTTYNEKRQTLSNLQGATPFPKLENQKKVEAGRDKVIAAYRDLQKSLAALKVPPAEVSASAFQQELKRTLDAVLEKAGKAGITSQKASERNDRAPGSGKFDLGFDYLGKLPEGEAARPLARQLKVIEWVVNLMIESKVAALPEITRRALPEEKAGGKAKPADGGKKGGKGAKDETAENLIKRSSFSIAFTANEQAAAKVLNGIATCNEQFLVIRKLKVTNTSPNPPAKTPQAAPAVAPARPPVGPGHTNPPGPAPRAEDNSKLTFIFGEEMVEVEAEIEILDIAQPVEPPSKTVKKP